MSAHEEHHKHDHSSGHHGHSHAPKDFGRAFAIGITLNVIYVFVETIVGLSINSLGLLADAGHNASDVFSLIIAWFAAQMAKRPPSERFTYGLKRSPIVASLFNAVLLFVAMGFIAFEAVERFSNPSPVPGSTIVWVTAIGLVVNFGTAALFMRGQDDLNIRGAYLHMMADGLVTLGVLIAGVTIALTGWLWLDSAISLAIVGVVLWSTWGLFRDAMRLSLDAAPANVDVAAIRATLLSMKDVLSVHDLHVWALSTTQASVTAHLVVTDDADTCAVVVAAQEQLSLNFKLGHSTLQVERPTMAKHCASVGCA